MPQIQIRNHTVRNKKTGNDYVYENVRHLTLQWHEGVYREQETLLRSLPPSQVTEHIMSCIEAYRHRIVREAMMQWLRENNKLLQEIQKKLEKYPL